MSIELSSLPSLISALFLVKIGFIIILGLYILFILVLYKQIVSMDNIFKEVHSSAIIKSISIINIFFAVSLFIAAIAIL